MPEAPYVPPTTAPTLLCLEPPQYYVPSADVFHHPAYCYMPHKPDLPELPVTGLSIIEALIFNEPCLTINPTIIVNNKAQKLDSCDQITNNYSSPANKSKQIGKYGIAKNILWYTVTP